MVTGATALRITLASGALALVAAAAQPLLAQSERVITGVVKNAVTGAPVANATVRVVSGNKSYVTAGDGTYRLSIDSVPAELVVTAIGFAPISRTVSPVSGAATVVTFELQPGAVPLDEIVTLGTRTHERTVTQSAVPIDVISAHLMESTGLPETWQQLQSLIPSVFGPHIPLFDNGMRPITLRVSHHIIRCCL
jgi:iron complex outermembrane recepter protein